MKAKEVHKLSNEELKVEAQRLRRRLYDLRSQAVTEKIENPSQLASMKRDVARILTEQRKRQLAPEAQA